MSDPLLSKYNVVIVDEAHERTLRTDLLIASLNTIQKKRNGDGDGDASVKGKGDADSRNLLKIVIMSATLDAENFSKSYHNADILCIQGRQHKVKIYHSANSQLCYVEAAMRTFFQMFPLEPQHACAVVVSKDYGCTSEVLDIVSIISASSKLFLDISDQREAVAEVRRKFRHPSGDYMTILNVVRAYRETAASEKEHARREWCRKHFLNERTLLEARDIREQLVVTCGRVGIDPAASTKENEDPVIRNMGSWVVCEFYVYPARRVLQTNYGTIYC